jgi:hypothetical protein
MEEDKYIAAVTAVGNLIMDAREQLGEALEADNWSRAAKLESFITGMKQAVEIFKQAKEAK